MTARAARSVAGFSVVERGLVGSSNDEAAALAQVGYTQGYVVRAQAQSAGRGRRGREWVSPAGNLYCSTVIEPDVPAERLAELSLVAGVAVAEAVESVVGKHASIGLKWPNDVLLGEGKVAGLLLEGGPIEKASPKWVVLGAGVNVHSRPVTGRYGSAAIADWAGSGVQVDAVLTAYLQCLGRWLAVWRRDGFAPIRLAWLDRARGVGQWIEVADREWASYRCGWFHDLGPGGSLVVAGGDGQLSEIAVGDVIRVGSRA